MSEALHTINKASEESFHDEWANSVDPASIPVRLMNEACTAPEMRAIRAELGNLNGKKLLDVGCGLGEAAVYFALEGATVTATDLSQGMLDATQALATYNGVTVRTHKSDAEGLRFTADELFDVIYVGNLFHHVDIEQTIKVLIPHLKKDGTLISWDPLAYNPIINVYRKMAMGVRTEDEHPFTVKDIQSFSKYFTNVKSQYYWFTTLSIFIAMALLQRRNPSKERFWKKVVEEADKWEWIYKPLAKVDGFLLSVFPFLRPYCWNVVMICKNPK
jgi:2-polyprenyl-3-methyl-5-hydroxy-6-metoxy-1,4-benzoquinol methylase